MPYLRFHLGCNANCRCAGRRAPTHASFGETPSTSKFSEAEREMVASGAKKVITDAAVKPGIRDVNRLSDQIFFARYPGRNGKLIDPKREPNLAEEWKNIKRRLVLPILEAVILFKKGMKALDTRDYTRAIGFFDRARRVSISPADDRARATHYLGVASFDLKRFAAAIGYAEVVRTFPGISDVLRAQSEALFVIAKQAYSKAVP